MGVEKATALRECDRMRLHLLDCVERCTVTADQVLFDFDLNHIDHFQRTQSQQIDGGLNDACNRVFDGRQQVVGDAVIKAAVEVRKGSARHQFDFSAEQFV